jgi:hypothetical protein
MAEITESNCTVVESDTGKVRCAVDDCAKLFKGNEFLKKHLQNKHPELSQERLILISEPYMLNRFEAVPITMRQLPPVEVEGNNGKIEIKSIMGVRDNALGLNTRKRRQSQENFDIGRGGVRGGFRGDYMSGMYHHPPPPQLHVPPPVQVLVDPNVRTVNAYRDVDAPVAVSCVDSDFGVSLPPPKKRKLVIKKK